MSDLCTSHVAVLYAVSCYRDPTVFSRTPLNIETSKSIDTASLLDKEWRCINAVACFCINVIIVKIGSGNGLLPDRQQAITWTNADLLSIGSLGTKLIDIFIYKKIPNFSFKKNAFTQVVCKMVVILFTPQCVNLYCFYPRPVLAFKILSLPVSVCICVRPCVNHKFAAQ